MRNIKILGLLFIGLLFGPQLVKADDFSVAITTYPITEVATMAAQLSGEKKINKLVISSSSTAQSVTAYKLCGSTTTVTALFTLQIPANSLPVILDYPFGWPLTVTDVCFRKTDHSTTVYAILQYRVY
jgi:hypothetical protein